jgi:uncharacterized protein YndB with AHSA1/START domain
VIDGSTVEIRRSFRATPERVFAAFANPELVARWLTPSPDIRVTVLRFEFLEGGAYRLAYHLPDGTTSVIGGTYRTIVPPSKIVFSWVIEPPDEHAGIDSEVTVSIARSREATELVIRHERLKRRDAMERHGAGWQGALVALNALLETRAG